MKKVLPILFVASTALITAASLTVASNGGFTQLRADRESHGYSLTFNKDNVIDSNVTGSFSQTGTFTLRSYTTCNEEFKVINATASGYRVYFNKSGSNNIVDVDAYDDRDSDASFNMTFQFHGVLSAVSVKLTGSFVFSDDSWEDDTNQLTFTGSDAVDGDVTIVASKSELNSFYITSIVAEYTCSY